MATPPRSRSDPASRAAERRRRRRAGHRRLAIAVSLLALMILVIGLGVGLGGRGAGPGSGGGDNGTTSSSAGGPGSTEGSSTTTATGGVTSSSTTTTSAGGAGSSSTTSSTTAASGSLVYQAQLSGAGQVPAVDTAATGTLTLTVAADRSRVAYVLSVKDIRNLTVARLHQGKAGQVGATIATLYPGPTKTGTFTGVLASGSFTSSTLSGPLAGKSISNLVALLDSGSVYLNIGTTAHRSGEIRGQLRGPASPAQGSGGTSTSAPATTSLSLEAPDTGG